VTPTLLSGVLLLTTGAPGLKDKPQPESTLVGEWAAESVNVGGRPSTPGSDRWVFRPDGTMSIMSQGQVIGSRDYTLGDKAAVRALDLVQNAAQGRADLSLYRIDGDTLTLSVGHQQGGRPADLEPKPMVTVWVFKRIKDR
jgi:uncharacterized protein (TIGR03067 family)